jgi:hypothetical protein
VAVGFLSKEWLDGVDLVGAGERGSGADGRRVHVRRVVSGGPDGEVVLEADVTGPALPGGPAEAATLTLTTTHDVATAIDGGEVAAAVAFMQGRLKAEGDMPTMYALLAATS